MTITVQSSNCDEPLTRLQREVDDLRIALQISEEHGDLTQEHLYRISDSLTAEIRERQATEEKLRKLVEAITREKTDLEIMVQILTEQGDQSALEGEKARIDSLTQIANRRRFDEFLSEEWKRHVATGEPLSLILCDVDHFKLFNDHYGHQAGDNCLQTFAKVISSCFRPGDVVARYGGEEFAVVLPGASRESAVRAAQEALVAVRSAALAHAKSPVSDWVTLSIGVGCATAGGNIACMRELIAVADKNLYLAKHSGRNRVTWQGSEGVAR